MDIKNYLQTLLEISENTFSAREISVLIWFMAFLCFILSVKGVRQSLKGVFRALIQKTILSITFLLLLYVSAGILLFNKISIWNTFLIKDTIIWFMAVAMIMIFSINKIKESSFFIKTIKDCFKVSILFEFILNLYTFNIWIELFLVPLITIISVMQVFAKTKSEYTQIEKVLTNILSIFGGITILYAIYKTIDNYMQLFTPQHALELLLPGILTVWVIPFVYGLKLYSSYEILFVKIDFMTNDTELKQKLKQSILLHANINLNKLWVVEQKLNKVDFLTTPDISRYLKGILNKNNPL